MHAQLGTRTPRSTSHGVWIGLGRRRLSATTGLAETSRPRLAPRTWGRNWVAGNEPKAELLEDLSDELGGVALARQQVPDRVGGFRWIEALGDAIPRRVSAD